jgi:uncharacterized cupredoxin-like copper-binding protein
MKTVIAILATASLLASMQVQAHGGESHREHAAPAKAAGPSEPAASPAELAFGRVGDPAKAQRTITIDMADTMRFSPADIIVTQGETVRFLVANKGKLLHEMVLGTEADLQKHAESMRKSPGMQHAEPYMVHVQPGGRGGFAWTFTKAGTFSFACLVAGHMEAGMKGRVVVKAR